MPIPARGSHLYRIAGAAACVLAFSACGQSTGTGGGQDSGAGQITRYPVAERKAVPEVSGSTLDGSQLDLKSLRGKVVVLNVWGSWCPPCRAEMPVLKKVSDQDKTKDVRFVGLDTRDVTDQAQAFLKSVSVDYPSIADPKGDLLLRFAGIIPPSATPCTVVIDRQGRVAARAINGVTEANLHSMIDPVLAEPA